MATVTQDGHADKNGKIARTYGDTELRTLRNMYGKGFAHDFPDHARLSELIGRIDTRALSLLHRISIRVFWNKRFVRQADNRVSPPPSAEAPCRRCQRQTIDARP
jgi:hypothetical protein